MSQRILTVVVLLTVMVAGGMAQTVQVSIPDTTAQKDDTLLIPIRVSALTPADSVYSGEMTLSYNSGVIDIIGIESSGTLSAPPMSITFNAATQKLAFANADIITGSGVFVNLRTHVRPSPTRDTTTIFFPDTAFNEGSPKISLDPGLFRVLLMKVSPKSPPSLLVVGDSLQFSVSGDQVPPLTWTSNDTTVGKVDSNGTFRALASGQVKIHVQDSQGLKDSTNLFAVYPAQAASLALSVPDTSYTQTLHFNLPIYVSDVTGLDIISAQVTLTFSGARLQATDVIQDGSMTSAWSSPSFSISSGRIEIALAGAQPLTGSGILAFVRMKVLPTASGVSSVSFSDVLFNENLNANTTAGQFTPLPAPTVVVSPGTAKLVRGETLQFSVTSGGTAPYQWSSSDSVVASINPATGLLTALDRGTTTVAVVDSFGFVGTSGEILVTDVQASLPDTAVWPQDSVDVPVFVDDLTGLEIYSFEMRVRHDSLSVQFLSVVNVGTLSGSFNISYKDTLDTLRIAGAGTAPLSGAGVLLKLRFKAMSFPSPPEPLEFTKFEFNEPGPSTPTALTTNGSLAVVEAAQVPALFSPGNGDTSVSVNPLLRWYSSTGALTYRLQLSTDSTFVTTTLDSSGLSDTVVAVSGLSEKTRYYWRVNAANSGGVSAYSPVWNFLTTFTTSVEKRTGEMPQEFALSQNYPNPFNPSTVIPFGIPELSHVTIRIYDLLGRHIITLFDALSVPGNHVVRWNGRDEKGRISSAGVYFTVMVARAASTGGEAHREVRKLLLVK